MDSGCHVCTSVQRNVPVRSVHGATVFYTVAYLRMLSWISSSLPSFSSVSTIQLMGFEKVWAFDRMGADAQH